MTPAEQRRFAVVLCLVFVLSLFEAASVLSILPFLQVLANPGIIETNQVFSRLYAWGDFTSTQSFMIFVGAVSFFVTVFGLLFKGVMIWVMTRFAMMRSYGISSQLLSGYLHQPYAWFLGRHSADLGSGVLNEVDRMVAESLLPAMRLIPDVLIAIFLIGILFAFEPYVAIGATVLLGSAYTLIYLVIRGILRRIGQDRVAANKARFYAVQEATGGIKEMKLLGLERIFLQHFRDAAYKMANAQTLLQVFSQVPRFALEGLAFGGMILLILILVVRDNGDLSTLLPTLGLIAVAGMRLFPALQHIYSRLATIRFGEEALNRLHKDIVAIDPKRAQKLAEAETYPTLHLRDTLVLEDIQYHYPEAKQSALTGLSLEIRSNTTVGIVGGTGAGKTTLVDVMLGLLEPTAGRILVDGTEVTSDLVRPWQKTLGYVPQQIFLSDTSIARNIAFGMAEDEIDMARVEEVARQASLHDFVTSEMREGYHTAVGERGVRLSGGQRQRIGIARALYHNPDVLIMDEATSALDNLTERAVMEAVHNIGGKKTIIMIAHRLTTVKACSEIFMLRQGKVAAQGPFDALVEADQEFRQMSMGH